MDIVYFIPFNDSALYKHYHPSIERVMPNLIALSKPLNDEFENNQIEYIIFPHFVLQQKYSFFFLELVFLDIVKKALECPTKKIVCFCSDTDCRILEKLVTNFYIPDHIKKILPAKCEFKFFNNQLDAVLYGIYTAKDDSMSFEPLNPGELHMLDGYKVNINSAVTN